VLLQRRDHERLDLFARRPAHAPDADDQRSGPVRDEGDLRSHPMSWGQGGCARLFPPPLRGRVREVGEPPEKW
jgi:hypothetical protein